MDNSIVYEISQRILSLEQNIEDLKKEIEDLKVKTMPKILQIPAAHGCAGTRM